MVLKKLWKNFAFWNFRSEPFSIHTFEGIAPASELVLLRGSLASKIELQGWRGKPRVQNCISRGRCRLRKTENILSAHNDRETWNVDKSSFQKTMKKFWLRKFLVRVILGTYLLGQSSRFRARVAKGRSPSAIALQGGSLESKILFRGVGANSKNRKYIFASKAQTTHPLPVPRL